jgi:hypothetical protein
LNIFAVDEDPAVAAQMLCDQHVSKMILESAQMLSYVADRYGHPALYKATGSHKNHPCTLWAGNRRKNWQWLVDHSLAMEKEKIYRTGKGHMSAEVIRYYVKNNYGPPEDHLLVEPFALCIPEQYRPTGGVLAYREFYLKDKQFFKNGKRPTWKKRSPPSWWSFRGLRVV